MSQMKQRFLFILFVFFCWFSLPVYGQLDPEQEKLKQEIRWDIEKANYCNSTQECKVVSFGCPFGCWSFVNKDFDIKPIQDKVQEYHSRYGRCQFRCDRLTSVVCKDSKCVEAVCEPDKGYRDNECKCPWHNRKVDYFDETKKEWMFKCVP